MAMSLSLAPLLGSAAARKSSPCAALAFPANSFFGSPLASTADAAALSPAAPLPRVAVVVAAGKDYKMKTHKASAKRFRVTGTGKIVRRCAGKQHLLSKKSAKRRKRLSKMYCSLCANITPEPNICAGEAARHLCGQFIWLWILGAPFLPLLFILVNMAFNISLLNLVKMLSALVASLTATSTVPISIYILSLPLPYIPQGAKLSTSFIIGGTVMLMGLILYNLPQSSKEPKTD